MASVEPTKRDPVTGRAAKGSPYRARYRDPIGRSRSKTFPTKGEADRFLQRNGTAIQRGEWTPPELRRTTVAHWAEIWWATAVHLAPSTRKGYKTALTHVLRYFGSYSIGSVDRAACKAFVADLTDRGLKWTTIKNTVSVLSLVMTEAIEGQAIRENPASRLKIRRGMRPKMHFLAAGQLELLAESTRSRYGTAIRLIGYTGLRPSEFCALTVGAIDLHNGVVQVRQTLMRIKGEIYIGATKTYQTRPVPIPSALVAELGEYLIYRSEQLGRPLNDEDWLFPGLTEDFLVAESFRRYILKPALKKAGLPATVRPYDLRHTYAALLISVGAHPKVVMERMGHSSIAITMNTYGHVFPTLDERVTVGLDDLLAASKTESDLAQPSVAYISDHQHRRSSDQSPDGPQSLNDQSA